MYARRRTDRTGNNDTVIKHDRPGGSLGRIGHGKWIILSNPLMLSFIQDIPCDH